MNANDLAQDALAFDGAENVAVTLRRADGQIALSVAGALRGPLARGERDFAGVTLSGDEVVWHVPDAALAGNEIHPGDSISAGAQAWVVVAVEHSTLGTRWRCVCRLQP